jgi:hypothetical protein
VRRGIYTNQYMRNMDVIVETSKRDGCAGNWQGRGGLYTIHTYPPPSYSCSEHERGYWGPRHKRGLA